MEPLKLEESPLTPEINFDADLGLLEFKGKSIPDNPLEFFQPIMEWLENYAGNPKQETTVNIYLFYFNSASSKYLLDFFKQLEQLHDSGRSDVTINWHYEKIDENSMEDGQDFMEVLELPFNLVEVEEL